VFAVGFGARRGEGTLLDCAGFLKRIRRLLENKHTAPLKSRVIVVQSRPRLSHVKEPINKSSAKASRLRCVAK
jgi:hypothetical protein